MLADYAIRFVKLCGMISTIVFMAYMLSSTKVAAQFLFGEEQPDWRTSVYVALIFGGFAFINAVSTTTHGASVRILAPMFAGLLGNRVVCVGAVIGGIAGVILANGLGIGLPETVTGELWLAECMTVLGVVTLGRQYRTWRKRKEYAIIEVVGLAVAGELVVHLPCALLFGYPNDLVQRNSLLIFPPMIVANAFGAALFWLVMNNFRRRARAERERKRLSAEFATAHRLQQSFLPDAALALPERFKLGARTCTHDQAHSIFYDYYMRDNRVFMVVGQAAGQGMAAALAVAALNTIFRVCSKTSSPERVLKRYHKSSLRYGKALELNSVGVCEFDIDSGMLEYCLYGSAQLLTVAPQGTARALPCISDAQGLCSGLTMLAEGDSFELVIAETKLQCSYESGLREAVNGYSSVWRLRGKHDELPAIYAAIDRFSVVNQLEQRLAYGFKLIFEELAVNAIDHSVATVHSSDERPRLIFGYIYRKPALYAYIAFLGAQFNPLTDAPQPLAGTRAPGGWGVFLVKRFSGRLRYFRENGYNILTIELGQPD